MSRLYINEFIYFDMMAGIRRLKTEAIANGNYEDDILKLVSILECIGYTKGTCLDSYIDSRAKTMKKGVGQCFLISESKKAKVSPIIEKVNMTNQKYLKIEDINKIKTAVEILNSDNSVVIDEYGHMVTTGKLSDTDKYIKECMKTEGFTRVYYAITNTGMLRYVAGINSKENNKYCSELTMKRFMLFGLVE